jgi:hypothetical protein
MALILKQYKNTDGSLNFPALFNIPSGERIPAIASKDFRKAVALISGAITMAFKSLQLKKGLNEIQILDIAEAIVDTSVEDNLGIEDLVLFLQGLVRGKYGTSFENINTPKFLELFEEYRQERHHQIIEIRENSHLQFKGMGDANRSQQPDQLSEHFSRLGDVLNTMKTNLRELKHENDVLRKADNYYGDKKDKEMP